MRCKPEMTKGMKGIKGIKTPGLKKKTKTEPKMESKAPCSMQDRICTTIITARILKRTHFATIVAKMDT